VIEALVKNTVMYAKEVKGDYSLTLDNEMLKLFLAILLISGYAVPLRRCMYWEQ
jgi:hypothetical protein